ncbi:MAG: phosphatidylserine decarboxylase [Clostridia bacterium]|nr:phosphatidylserine decarboxylase [Clostridia bacterium]
MALLLKDRNGKYILVGNKQERTLKLLYKTMSGRMILKLLTRPMVSKVTGKVLSSRLSAFAAKSAIKKRKIETDMLEKTKFRSYNDFFTRKLKEGGRVVDMEPNSLVSPCDSKLSVYPIDADSRFIIKGTPYTVTDLLGGDSIADDYLGGTCLVFRLAVDDYHRYCYFDNGTKGDNTYLKGVLHTVHPIVVGEYNIYKRNCREYTVMDTENFGKVVQVEVGALMVGKIKNFHSSHSFKRGEEKGMFEFGGSTIVLLLKKGAASLDSDIVENSRNGVETIVKYGEKIGVKADLT